MDALALKDLITIPEVWERLEQVEARLFEASTSQDQFLTKIAQHLLAAGGKRFRPLLAQLTAELGPNLDGRAIDAGAAVELIHIGSLYHDDVIDEADVRRAAVSVNANWSNTIAILAGDFLMARASELAADSLGLDAVKLLARTYAELVEGQTLELQLEGDVTHGPDDYYRVIGGKTASLIRTSARLGALSSDASSEIVEAVSTATWELGMVFQITDDALDLVADAATIGKPAGSDINQGVYTLPVLHGLVGPDGSRIRDLLSAERPFADDSVAEVIELVRSGGFVSASLDECEARLQTAEDAIAILPEGDPKSILTAMGRFLITRVEAARN
ncbi:MAG TPA: polyprenyl synthetase family protein [Actinobacteria bacterium]|nr:polyprenyl synthetase family protein [Actinomycetota bacterium]